MTAMAKDLRGALQPCPTTRGVLQSPRGHNRDLDPGFEEDPDIFVELEEGVFYQASYDGTEVPIMADCDSLVFALSYLLEISFESF